MGDDAVMRAVVLDAPGPPEALRIQELPTPAPELGWVLIEVKAFGLNRSELHTRLGLAEGVTFPRVPGIEATGVVVEAPGGEFAAGQQVVAMMGGMGRQFDGGYAEYTCVPAANVIPFRSELAWSTLGAVPEMLQTAYGSLDVGLDLQAGQTLLIRGGTSSVGMVAAVLAKSRGATVLSTTRRADRLDALRAVGVDHPLVDDGEIEAEVRDRFPHSMEFNYLPLSALVTGPDRYDWAPLERLLDSIAGRGHQAVVRVYLEYPGKTGAIPPFLVDGGLKVHRYRTEESGRAGEHQTPDYADPKLRAVLSRYIAGLAGGMSTVSIRYTVAFAVCTPPHITFAPLTSMSSPAPVTVRVAPSTVLWVPLTWSGLSRPGTTW